MGILIPKTNDPEHDLVWTPEWLAKDIIKELKPKGLVLDPCRGPGAFYNNFPDDCEKDWCELSEGKDFFNYTKKVDWIITNPLGANTESLQDGLIRFLKILHF